MTPTYEGKMAQVFVAPQGAVIEIWGKMANWIEKENIPHAMVNFIDVKRKINLEIVPLISQPFV